ncbi:MAG TPA: serine hydrolase domain-containing protein [Chitinophagaceae bacterium]|nr:serine hydrolase domain-containing protein [Chitinophagaceae bacterium]
MKGIQKKVLSHILYALNKGGHTALFPIGVALLVLLPFIQACQTGKGQSSQSFLDSSYYSAKAYYDSISFHKQSVLSSPETKKVQKGLDHFYNHVLGSRFNGAMLVAKKGVVIFEKYQGYANFEKKIPITKKTGFQLASTSKPFTSMGILYLQSKGKLKVTDSIQKFFPKLAYPGVTIKDLLTHRSGLPEYLYFVGDYRNVSELMSNQDVIDLMVKYQPDRYNLPDHHYSYTNTNFMLLGAIIQKVTGKSLENFFNDVFFEPLGMKHTFVYNPNTGRKYKNRSLTYNYRTREIPNECFDGVVGDKNVYSTVEDLFKWSKALYPGNLFTKEELQAAFKPYSHEHPGIRNYGFGWHLYCYPDGRKIVYHNGWWHGNTSSFYRLIDKHITIIILSNRFNKQVYHVDDIWKLLDAAEYGGTEV